MSSTVDERAGGVAAGQEAGFDLDNVGSHIESLCLSTDMTLDRQQTV